MATEELEEAPEPKKVRKGKHSLFNLESIMEFKGLRESLKEKPLYKLYAQFEKNLKSNKYRKILKTRTEKEIEDAKNKKRLQE